MPQEVTVVQLLKDILGQNLDENNDNIKVMVGWNQEWHAQHVLKDTIKLPVEQRTIRGQKKVRSNIILALKLDDILFCM